MSKKKIDEICINTIWCKGCGICVHFCPQKVLTMNKSNKAEVSNLLDCIGCKLCELRCTDLAIEVTLADKKE